MNTALAAELEHRAAQGQHPVNLPALDRRLRELGYRLDRSMDCRSWSRWMSGPRSGQSYPVTTTDIVEADTGLSFSNVPLARRDANFQELQRIRREGELFAVVRGSILEI